MGEEEGPGGSWFPAVPFSGRKDGRALPTPNRVGVSVSVRDVSPRVSLLSLPTGTTSEGSTHLVYGT